MWGRDPAGATWAKAEGCRRSMWLQDEIVGARVSSSLSTQPGIA